MTGHEASRFYDIPDSTIRSWKSKNVTSKKRSPPTTLKLEEKIALIKWCEGMHDVAHCVTLQMLKSKVE